MIISSKTIRATVESLAKGTVTNRTVLGAQQDTFTSTQKHVPRGEENRRTVTREIYEGNNGQDNGKSEKNNGKK